MKVEISTLCEYAADHLGRLTIVDTFDTISAQKFPWRAYFHFAAKINLEDRSNDYQKIKMLIIKDDDNHEKLFEAESTLQKLSNSETMNLVAGLKGLIFNTSGQYLFQVIFDNETIINHPFRVNLKDEKQH